MVVEDAEWCATTLEVALLAIPYVSVCVAPSALQALEVLRESAVSVLVTDLHLPVMDGFELIGHVRADNRFACVPIVVISGDPDPLTPERVYSLGVDAYFGKPYSPRQICEKVKELLEKPAPA